MIGITIIITFITCLVNLIIAYSNYFTQMGLLFAITFVLKRLFKSSNNKVIADLIGLAGYSLTIAVFINFLGAITGDIKGTPITDPNYINNLNEFVKTLK